MRDLTPREAVTIADLAELTGGDPEAGDTEALTAQTAAYGVNVSIADCIPQTVAAPGSLRGEYAAAQGEADPRRPMLNEKFKQRPVGMGEYGGRIEGQSDGSNIGALWWAYEPVDRDVRGRAIAWWQYSDINPGERTNFIEGLTQPGSTGEIGVSGGS